jgi:predicted nucleic acid-binding protein
MTPVLVDSSVLLDIINEDAVWEPWSTKALVTASTIGLPIINPVVYAEISARFESEEHLNLVMPTTLYKREQIPWPASFLAGRAFAAYRRRGGVRTSMLADFLIGAHAKVAGYRLLTRDVKRFRASFPDLELIAPDGR